MRQRKVIEGQMTRITALQAENDRLREMGDGMYNECRQLREQILLIRYKSKQGRAVVSWALLLDMVEEIQDIARRALESEGS